MLSSWYHPRQSRFSLWVGSSDWLFSTLPNPKWNSTLISSPSPSKQMPMTLCSTFDTDLRSKSSLMHPKLLTHTFKVTRTVQSSWNQSFIYPKGCCQSSTSMESRSSWRSSTSESSTTLWSPIYSPSQPTLYWACVCCTSSCPCWPRSSSVWVTRADSWWTR